MDGKPSSCFEGCTNCRRLRLSWSESLGEPKVLVVELLLNEHPVLPTFRLSLLLQFGLNIVTFSSIPQWATR